MLYDKSMAPEQRFEATLMPLPADAAFAKEQGHMGVIAQKKSFAIEYETIDHPSSLRDQQTEAWCRTAPFPSLRAFTAAAEEARLQEVVRRTGRGAPAGGAAAQLPKGSTAEIMRREAEHEVVFEGPSHIYREPRCSTRCASMLLGRRTVDVSDVPTRSRPEGFASRLPSSYSKALSKARARRDCAAAMADILTAWRKGVADGPAVSSGGPTLGGGEEGNARAAAGKFVDAKFFLGHRASLYPSGTAPDTHVAEPRDLASLCALYPTAPLFPVGDGAATAGGHQRRPTADDGLFSFATNGGGSSASDGGPPPPPPTSIDQYVVPLCRSTHLVAAAAAVLLGGEGEEAGEAMGGMGHGLESLEYAGCGQQSTKGIAALIDLFVVPEVMGADVGAPPPANGAADAPLSPTAFLRRFGFIGVLLYINGAWEWVIVDDLVTIDSPAAGAAAQPLMLRLVSRRRMEGLQALFGPFARTAAQRGRRGVSGVAAGAAASASLLEEGDDPTALWPHLLQKAAAKWFGSYDAVDGGSPRAALEMLTGGTVRAGTVPDDGSMMAFDAFDDETSGHLCLVYCTRELTAALGAAVVSKAGGAGARRERLIVDEATDCFMVHPSGGGAPVWLPRRLPLVLRRCFTSSEDARPLVRLASPWGVLGPSGATSVDLTWAEFVCICDYYELCTAPDPEQAYVEAFGLSGAPSANGRSFSFSLRAPLRAPVTVCVRQADPRSHFDLPYDVRRRLPCVGMAMTVTEAVGKSIVYSTPQPVVAIEHSVSLRLVPGEYTVRLAFDEAPSVPYMLRVGASRLVALRLWPTGLHPGVSGAATVRAPLAEVAAPASAEEEARAERLRLVLQGAARRESRRSDAEAAEEAAAARVPDTVRTAFGVVDVVERGSLDVRGTERAAAEYFFAHTAEGRLLRDAIAAQAATGDGKVSLAGFASLMRRHFGGDAAKE